MTDFLFDFEKVKTPIRNWRVRREMNNVRADLEFYKKENIKLEKIVAFNKEMIDTYEKWLSAMEKREQINQLNKYK